jgi:chemosensory pili system protein ChpA (sensor histidine kinase/response regulator)
MDSSRNAANPTEAGDDLSAVAWVQDELRRSLDAAHKALRRFVKESEALGTSGVEAVDPAVLRGARVHIHQGVGALELVGMPDPASVLRASENAVQRYVAKPHKLTTAVVDDIERASFAVLDYLARLLAGKTLSPLALFPQYRAVQEAAGAERVHPADLWPVDWRWREVPADPLAAPRQPDAATHSALEAQLLPMMRSLQPVAAAAEMSDICAGLGVGATSGPVSTLWKLASAMFEAQAQGLLGFDVFGKRMASRLLGQYRVLERGDSEVSDRLAQDLLFFCAQSASPGDGSKAPRLAAVRQVYGLAHHVPVDYSVSSLGRFDPAWIAQARKRVSAAKESWSAVAGGEMHRMAGLTEQFLLVADSLKRLFPLGETFGHELQQAITQTQSSNAAPPAPLAMEVATSLLYVEAALEDTDFDSPEQAERVKRLAERLSGVRQGRTPDPLESWMEELYRRVSDRQTMGSVVQELRASLSEAEKLIDQFFRNPLDRRVLIPVPNQLSSMRGVLSVLGMDQASAALLRMRDEVDGLASTEVEPERVEQAGVFERLAGNMGALGFLIDMLSVQPQMAKSLFRFDAAAGTLNPVMGRGEAPQPAAAAPVEPRLIEQAQLLAHSAVQQDVPLAEVSRELELLSQEAQAAEQPALAATVLLAQEAINDAPDEAAVAAAREQLSEALVDFVHTASEPAALDALPAKSAPMPVSGPFTVAELEGDDEMREIFLEEAREVLADANLASAELAHSPSDLSLPTSLRRAFHTLKGSSRMVGLKAFGDAAWVCEQLFNAHLAEQRPMDAAQIDFTTWVLGYLGHWVDDIAARRPTAHDAATVEAAAKRLAARQEEAGAGDELSDIALPLAAAAAAVPLGLPPDLPTAADLDLRVPAPAAVEAEPAPMPAPEPEPALVAEAAPEVAFELDLSALDEPFTIEPLNLGPDTELLDMEAQALNVPFDDRATEPLPLPDVAEVSNTEFSRGLIDLDLGDSTPVPTALPAEAPALVAEIPALALPTEPTAVPEAANDAQDFLEEPVAEEHVKMVGPLRISIPLFNIYLNEADELSRRLTTELAEWAMELHRPIGESPIALAHSLAGSSATVGFADLSQLARTLEHAQTRSRAIGAGTADEARLFVDAAEEVRRLLHQFAAGFLKEPAPELLARLAEHELSSARRLEAASAADEPPQALESELGAAPLPEAAAALVEAPASVPVEPVQPVAEAAVPEPEAQALAVMDTTPGVLAWAPSSLSAFGGIETRFDPLGVAELKPFEALTLDNLRPSPERAERLDIDDDIDAVDAVDAELFPIFEEEGQELLPQLAAKLRDWARRPAEAAHPAACMRTLHTLKGGARLAGAMRLGEMAHRLEGRIEHLLANPPVAAADIESLQAVGDTLLQTFEAVRSRDAQAYAEAEAAVTREPEVTGSLPVLEVVPLAAAVDLPEEVLAVEVSALIQPEAEIEPAPELPVAKAVVAPQADAPLVAPAPVVELPGIDWSRFAPGSGVPRQPVPERLQAAQSAVRVRAPLLDRLVNQAGEISITRSRIASEVGQIKGSLSDLTENLERLRLQLRDIELQAETQMSSRLEAAKAASQAFDPLEFDRFTRFQELTRMMAESVNDVATVQRTLQRALDSTEDELAAQQRLNRELQDDLLRTRMVEFEGLSDRLYRVVRQAAKETGKQVRLDIVGGSIDVDRGVLDRMTAAFEHLLRNCVTHGIEAPEVRSAAGKDATGSIVVSLTHEGNEVGVEFRDDGAGLDLGRIRSKGQAMGLLDPNAAHSDAELANLIFTPGFSTAETVTELAGRGVGMDVVRSDVNAMGGRVETSTAAGQGTAFKLILPLTTAVTQVVMLRCGATTVAVPSTLIEIVRRATPQEVADAYASGAYVLGERTLQFFWLGALLQLSPRGLETTGRTRTIVVIRSAQQRIALHVDEVLGNQEVVVKNLGTQLSRLPGLAGMTLLASGAVALIYNPVALATLYGDAARAATYASLQAAPAGGQAPVVHEPAVASAPLVMVVDDSLTVRRVTQRLLVREGYRVVLAKDGLDALERLAEELPQIVLSDIEMPRMDGFDLVRNIRGDARLRDLPVIMITSRIAQKHRDYAAELGVDHYLGKPYSEEDLLALVGRYTSAEAQA